MPFGVGLPEMLLIAFLALVFFGRNKVTALASDLGKSIKTFKQELSDVEDIKADVVESVTSQPKKKAAKKTAKKSSK
jgi:TatA/E family protein of Tat protein translocase